MKKMILSFATLALAAASAADSYRVTLYQPAQINGQTFKAGEVKVELHDGNVLFKQGKTSVEAKAQIEKSAAKYLNTTVDTDGDTKALKEIRLGGTVTKLVFEKTGTAAGN